MNSKANKEFDVTLVGGKFDTITYHYNQDAHVETMLKEAMNENHFRRWKEEGFD